MFRSVFTKLWVASSAILLVTLLVQSTLLGAIYQENLHERQKRDMIVFTQNLASSASDIPSVVRGVDFLYSIRRDESFRAVLGNAARQYKALIWLTDGMNDVIEVITDDTDDDQKSPNGILRIGSRSQYLFSKLRNGETVFMEGTLDGMFPDPMMTVGVPIYSGDVVVGAVVTHVQRQSMDSVYSMVNLAAAQVAIVAAFVGFALIYSITRRMVMPLRRMRDAAGEIAKNRFDEPLPITTQDEVGDLVSAFNQMAEQLQKQEQLRSGFIANVSHELRSPLTSMQGFAQGMLDGTIPLEDHGKYLGIIHSETQRLSKLIRELLNLSQIESGKFPLHIQRFDANELIRRVLIRYLDNMDEKGIEMEVDFKEEYCYVDADADRMEQVIINLIDNAIKFTPNGGKISIWTHVASDRAILAVADTGSGIPLEDQPYIFERFYKVDKAHTGKTGTGLGLAIVKKIIDQHDGSVTVRSQMGKGTSFVVEVRASDNQDYVTNDESVTADS